MYLNQADIWMGEVDIESRVCWNYHLFGALIWSRVLYLDECLSWNFDGTKSVKLRVRWIRVKWSWSKNRYRIQFSDARTIFFSFAWSDKPVHRSVLLVTNEILLAFESMFEHVGYCKRVKFLGTEMLITGHVFIWWGHDILVVAN